MKMVPTTCINILLWAWLNEWLFVAWGPIKGRFATAGRSLVRCRKQCNGKRERERKERCCDKRRCLVRYLEKILERE